MANARTGLELKSNTEVDANKAARKSVALLMNELLDSEGIKSRIHELLGKRAAQFTGSLVSLINASDQLKKAFQQCPMSVIQAGLRAATYDLPVDPGLGYAYIVPFNNTVKPNDAKPYKRMEATFIMGYKGMYQLAMRTGAYSKLNVVDIREGELLSYNRLTEDIELEFITDEGERNSKKIVGYCGFFRLVNGMEKIIYKSIKELDNHELKFRKGTKKGYGWSLDTDAMYRKTILRMLIGKWGIMSIDYQTADDKQIALAEAVAKGLPDGENQAIDVSTGEYIPQGDDGGISDEEAARIEAGMEDTPENAVAELQ